MLHWNALDERTLRVLYRLRDHGVLKEFYLSGGTALALHLTHRTSVDLDFFTRNPVRQIQSSIIERQCSKIFGESAVRIVVKEVDQLWLEIEGIKVTFLAYPFSRVSSLHIEDGIAVASIRDIAVQKAYVIGRRATARDYVDMAFILRSGEVSLEQIVHDAQNVLVLDGEPVFSTRIFLCQLVYTDDVTDKDAAIRTLFQREDFESIVDTLRKEVERATPRLLGEN